MPRISSMPPPALPLNGLELVPALQGGGADGNIGLPIFTMGPPFGGAVLALRAPMEADLSSTADADPGAAAVRWNDADPGLATELYISDVDSDAGDVAAALAALDVGGFLYVQGAADTDARDNWQKWQVTSVTASTGYTRIGVTLQQGAGAFVDDDPLEVSVQQPVPSPGIDRNVLTNVGSSSGALTFDASLGDYFKTTLSENVSSLSISNVPTVCTLGFWLTQDSTPRTFAWPGSFDWGEGNSAPDMPVGAGKELFVVISTSNAGGKWDASARVRS